MMNMEDIIWVSLALKYVNDSLLELDNCSNCRSMGNYMLKTNFLGIQSYGAPTGVDQKPKLFQRWVLDSPFF